MITSAKPMIALSGVLRGAGVANDCAKLGLPLITADAAERQEDGNCSARPRKSRHFAPAIEDARRPSDLRLGEIILDEASAFRRDEDRKRLAGNFVLLIAEQRLGRMI